MSSADPVDAAYQALARRAWDTNRGRAGELAAIVTEWRRAGVLTAEQRESGRSVAHGMRGSAGTFGHDRAARAAEELEELLSSAVDEALLDVVERLLARIEAALTEAPKLEL